MLWTTVITITPADRRMNGKMSAAARAAHQTIHSRNFRTPAFLAPTIKQDHSKRCENKPLQHRQAHPRDAKAPLFSIQAHRPGKPKRPSPTTTKKARQCGPFLKLVGARGFEPPTSASRRRRSTRLSHAPITYFKNHAAQQMPPKKPGLLSPHCLGTRTSKQ